MNFPSILEGHQLRKFQSSWFSKYPWLTYSRSENGGYCACCIFFANPSGNLGVLARSPLVKFKKALEVLALHEKTESHKNALVKMDAFLEYMSGKRQSVSAQLSSSYAAQIEHNRKVLRSVIATIELCGRQGLALHGHRDTLMMLIITLVTFMLYLNFGVMLVIRAS